MLVSIGDYCKNGWLSEYTWLKRRSSKNLGTEDIPNSEE